MAVLLRLRKRTSPQSLPIAGSESLRHFPSLHDQAPVRSKTPRFGRPTMCHGHCRANESAPVHDPPLSPFRCTWRNEMIEDAGTITRSRSFHQQLFVSTGGETNPNLTPQGLTHSFQLVSRLSLACALSDTPLLSRKTSANQPTRNTKLPLLKAKRRVSTAHARTNRFLTTPSRPLTMRTLPFLAMCGGVPRTYVDDS